MVLLGVFVLSLVGASRSAPAAPPKPILLLREGLDGPINEWSGPAKFVLYDDGTVFTETSNELAENSGDLNYLRSRLTPAQADRLLKSLRTREIIGKRVRQYGKGEGVTWQLIYWSGSKRGDITIIDDLKQAPASVRRLVSELERYPKRGTPYLGYDYLLEFGNPYGNIRAQTPLPWPKELQNVKFAQQMLSGLRAPDMNYEYRLAAPRALQLRRMLTRAKTECVAVNGHIWRVRFSPAPQLPNDLMWVWKHL